MSNLPISELPALSGPSLAAVDALALADLSGSETVQIPTKTFIQSGIALIDDDSIPWEKVGTIVLL